VVAKVERGSVGDAIEQLADLLFIEAFWQGGFAARGVEVFGGATGENFSGDEEAEENFQCEDLDAQGGWFESGLQAVAEDFAAIVDMNGVDIVDPLMGGFAQPNLESFELSADEKLVIIGESSFGGEVADEAVDEGIHLSWGWRRKRVGGGGCVGMGNPSPFGQKVGCGLGWGLGGGGWVIFSLGGYFWIVGLRSGVVWLDRRHWICLVSGFGSFVSILVIYRPW